jgi:hypothetical protein
MNPLELVAMPLSSWSHKEASAGWVGDCRSRCRCILHHLSLFAAGTYHDCGGAVSFTSFGWSWHADSFFSLGGTAGMVAEPHRRRVVKTGASQAAASPLAKMVSMPSRIGDVDGVAARHARQHGDLAHQCGGDELAQSTSTPPGRRPVRTPTAGSRMTSRTLSGLPTMVKTTSEAAVALRPFMTVIVGLRATSR